MEPSSGPVDPDASPDDDRALTRPHVLSTAAAVDPDASPSATGAYGASRPLAVHPAAAGTPSRDPDASVLDGLIRHPPFHQWLGVTVESVARGRVILGLPPNPEFVGNPFIPAVHGGILAALIDLAGGAALFLEVQFPTPTIDMRIDYLRPAIAGKRLHAEARVKSLGKTVAFVDVDVTDDDSRLVATGRCAYSVKDQEAGPRGFPIG